jgi:hypothetical protein
MATKYRKIVVPPPLVNDAVFHLAFVDPVTHVYTVVHCSDLLPILKRIAEEYSMGNPSFIIQIDRFPNA